MENTAFVCSTTLSHGNDFKWLWDERKGIKIQKIFSFNGEEKQVEFFLPIEAIGFVYGRLSHLEEWPLANKVDDLYRGVEKEGIGWALYQFDRDTGFAQCSSQLVAIMHEAGIWKWNNKKRGMMFEPVVLAKDWKEVLGRFYVSKI